MKLIHKFNPNHGAGGKFVSHGMAHGDRHLGPHEIIHTTEGTNTRTGREWRQYDARGKGHSSPTIASGMNRYVKRTGLMAVHARMDGKVNTRFKGNIPGFVMKRTFDSAQAYHAHMNQFDHSLAKAGNPHRGKDGKFTSGGPGDLLRGSDMTDAAAHKTNMTSSAYGLRMMDKAVNRATDAYSKMAEHGAGKGRALQHYRVMLSHEKQAFSNHASNKPHDSLTHSNAAIKHAKHVISISRGNQE